MLRELSLCQERTQPYSGPLGYFMHERHIGTAQGSLNWLP